LADLIAAQFLAAPNGTEDFGEVDAVSAAACGVAAGPVRLQHGYEGAEGFGNRHVEAYPARMKQLANLGYPTFAAFAYAVAQSYQRIGDGDRGRLLLIYRSMGYDLRLVIQHNAQGGFWTIVTGLPYRVARCKILFAVTRTGRSEPTPSPADQGSRFATLSLPKTKSSGGSGS
jgi:hypothetical protein